MIVEDHADFRDLMGVLLDRQPDIELLAKVSCSGFGISPTFAPFVPDASEQI